MYNFFTRKIVIVSIFAFIVLVTLVSFFIQHRFYIFSVKDTVTIEKTVYSNNQKIGIISLFSVNILPNNADYITFTSKEGNAITNYQLSDVAPLLIHNRTIPLTAEKNVKRVITDSDECVFGDLDTYYSYNCANLGSVAKEKNGNPFKKEEKFFIPRSYEDGNYKNDIEKTITYQPHKQGILFATVKDPKDEVYDNIITLHYLSKKGDSRIILDTVSRNTYDDKLSLISNTNNSDYFAIINNSQRAVYLFNTFSKEIKPIKIQLDTKPESGDFITCTINSFIYCYQGLDESVYVAENYEETSRLTITPTVKKFTLRGEEKSIYKLTKGIPANKLCVLNDDLLYIEAIGTITGFKINNNSVKKVIDYKNISDIQCNKSLYILRENTILKVIDENISISYARLDGMNITNTSITGDTLLLTGGPKNQTPRINAYIIQPDDTDSTDIESIISSVENEVENIYYKIAYNNKVITVYIIASTTDIQSQKESIIQSFKKHGIDKTGYSLTFIEDLF